MSLELEILTVVIGAIWMLVVLYRVPGRRRRVRVQPPQAMRPADLARVEHDVAARHAAAEVHARLRPLLAEIAMSRLGRRRRLTTAEAQTLLGEELWELVRPDRPRPADPHGPGLSLDQLTQMVERLEQL
jgi:hypothetical protein